MTFTPGGPPITAAGLGAYLGSMQLIYSTVLAAPAASVLLPGSGTIPQTFSNLRLVVSAQSSGSSSTGYDPAFLRINGVATASYNWNSWYTTQGASAVSVFGAVNANSMQVMEIWNSHFGSAGRGIAVIDIPNYADTNNFKVIGSQSSASDGGTVSIMQTYTGSLGGTTAAVSTLTALATGNFVADSSFFLYGM